MNCPICLELIYKSATPSCSHHFCYSCLKNCCLQGIYICPICKLDIKDIKFDKEFDFINNKNNIEYSINNFNKIIIDFDNNDEAGITLQNYFLNNKRRPGVKVKSLKNDQKMYKSGIRKNDIILFINNIPCSDHVNSIKLINYASANGKTMICELLK